MEHPEWETWRDMTLALGIPQPEADAAWQLLLGGVDSQGELNAEATARTSSRQEQREIRMTNSWYHAAVDLIADHLAIERPTMALWAGGFDTSEYAYEKGHMPLARTRIGSVLNALKLHSNDKLTGPMWNLVSKAFVSRANGPVHIFVRAYDPDSILIRLEVPHLHLVKQLNPDVKMIWHPLYTDAAGRTKEISKDFQLVDNAEYATRDTCASVLQHYLRLIHPDVDAAERSAVGLSAPAGGNGKKTAGQLAYASMETLLEVNGNKLRPPSGT
ncbi:hypothetical protein [Streptomyces apricus]|uniref:Uncharacterized protein n=1 Tax=Streptomyces apricus TaxID=1828112 RepID=A0A5A9ZW24_9ACTN|nr:hypothetical protein [Streptomyces apricus]KAA0921360.1 hypothetical protein FGF04_36955 [Streptomyces apricus]